MNILKEQVEAAQKKAAADKSLSKNEQALIWAHDYTRMIESRLNASELSHSKGSCSPIDNAIELRIFEGDLGECKHGIPDCRNVERMTIQIGGDPTPESIQNAVEIAERFGKATADDRCCDDYRHIQLVLNWQFVNM